MTFTKRLTLLASVLAISLVAWVLNTSQLYWMAATLALLPLVSRLFGRLEHRGLVIERDAPRTATLGDTLEVSFRVRNLTRLPKIQLALADDLPRGLVPMDPEPVPVHLAPRGQDRASYALRAKRRGVHTLASVRVVSADPLGLNTLETRYPVTSQLLVYPKIVSPLPPTVLPPEMGGGQAPLDTSHRQGQSSSFFGVREYRPGDPLRHVHWRTAARWGRLAVVEWETEESSDALIAIDTRRGTVRDLGDGTTLDLAAGLAASLASAVLTAGDSLRLLAPGATEWRQSAERGMESMPAVLETLARVDAVWETALAAELRQTAAQLAAGTLVCWITSSPDDALVSTARFLREGRLRPVVYLLQTGEEPQGAPAGAGAGSWQRYADELRAAGVPTIVVGAADELATQLLS